MSQYCCKICSPSNQNYAYLIFLFKAIEIVFSYALKFLSPLLFVAANILILAIIYLYFVFLLPVICGKSMLSTLGHMILGLFIAVNIIFNYIACFYTSPGNPPCCDDPGVLLGQRYQMIDGRPVYHTKDKLSITPVVFYIYCKHCKCIKPPRAHHCRVVGKCVYEMDHFCPWMANCVGYYNYRYFYLFLVYMFLGCLYCLSVTTNIILHLDQDILERILQHDSGIYGAVIFVFTVCLSGAISVCVLLVWHTFLIFTNQTTIEFYINMDERRQAKEEGEDYHNPFNLGWRNNLRRVFGDVPWYVALMPSVRLPVEPSYPLILEPPPRRGGSQIHLAIP